ncbi:hypothetical protein DV515_00004189, partial [Chloebia gouldiae]
GGKCHDSTRPRRRGGTATRHGWRPRPTVGSLQPGPEQPCRGSARLFALPGKRSSGRACAAHVAERDGELSVPGMPALTFVEALHQREMAGRSRGYLGCEPQLMRTGSEMPLWARQERENF